VFDNEATHARFYGAELVDGVRVLKEAFLHEISLVAVPANPRAQITAVKSLVDVQHVLKLLREDDVGEDALEHLLEIDRELKRLLVGHNPEEQKAATLRELQSFAAALGKLAA